MKKEAKGKPEQKEGQAGRRIPIEAFSTQRWAVQMKLSSTPAPLCSRELNLGALFSALYQKLAA